MQQKKYYHWRFLRATAPIIRDYEKEEDLYEAKGLDGEPKYLYYGVVLSGFLWLPLFFPKKSELMTETARFYAKRVRRFVALTLAMLLVLILEFVYLA